MSSRQWVARRGFSLAELLVVVAIVVVLSAMLLPVFARARERAREGDCLANVKSVCLAIQMYVQDSDGRLPPREHRQEAIDYFRTAPGGGLSSMIPACDRVNQANPYLRWPVILDEYVRNRLVWRCPEARLEQGAAFIIGQIDWLGCLMEYEGGWGRGCKFCLQTTTWPAGWGGEVTDSLKQVRLAGPQGPTSRKEFAAGVFVQSIGVNGTAAELDVKSVAEPKWFVICGDGGASVDRYGTGTLAYPDICALECGNEECGWADWEDCTWAADCGLYNHAPSDGSFLKDVELRKARARHNAGVHIGFLDGHVERFDSERVIAESPSEGNPERGKLRGYGPRGPTSDCDFAEDHPGVPTLY